ncbi:MAG TPA: hypothetical protein PKI26_10020, partial [Methanothrix sp.]|nr:hypothetical protein [Methanothrix sp.]
LCRYHSSIIPVLEVNPMSDDEKEQTIQEEDEHGNILIYPAWSKKNAPKESQSKWEVPIYL